MDFSLSLSRLLLLQKAKRRTQYMLHFDFNGLSCKFFPSLSRSLIQLAVVKSRSLCARVAGSFDMRARSGTEISAKPSTLSHRLDSLARFKACNKICRKFSSSFFSFLPFPVIME
jgi:hypothetical protein